MASSTIALGGGFPTGVILASCGFLLGAAFMALSVESGILYNASGPTEDDFLKVETFYLTMWTSPLAVKALLHIMMVAPLFALCFKIATYTEAAIYFDGLSGLMALGAVALYASSTVPSLRQLAFSPSTPALSALLSSYSAGGPATSFDPSSPFAFFNRFLHVLSYPSSLASPATAAKARAAFEQLLKDEPVTAERRKELLQVVAASHTMAMVLLVGVVVLQAGRWYAEREQAKMLAKWEKEQAAQARAVSAEKKSQ